MITESITANILEYSMDDDFKNIDKTNRPAVVHTLMNYCHKVIIFL